MRESLIPLLLALLLADAAAPAVRADEAGATLELASGERRVSLLELYTSEGCSSCPPADRWLSDLGNDRRLWRDFVPLALHVDYWDYIGWPDRFAKPAFGDRQRRYAREGGSLTVYTPGVFVNGREWLGWRRGDPPPGSDTRAGNLALTVTRDTVEVEFVADEFPAGVLRVHVGLLGMNRETAVRAGENRGRRLRHDFVLLELSSATLASSSDGTTAEVRIPIDLASLGPDAIVAWVSSKHRQAPLQAVGGFIPEL